MSGSVRWPIPQPDAGTAPTAQIITPPAVAVTAHERSASLDATAALAAANREFFSILTGSAAIAGTGAIQAAHQRDRLRQAALAATGTITAIGQIEGGAATFERSAAVAATAAITSAGEIAGALTRSASLNATASITVAYRRIHLRQTAIAATATISATPQRRLHRQTALTATAAINASGFVGVLAEYPIQLTYTEPPRRASYREREHATLTVRS